MLREILEDVGLVFYRIKESIIDFFRGIRWFIQRGKRGYADCDVWNFNSYLAEVIAGGVRELIEFNNSYPPEFNDGGIEWLNILKQIAEGFEAIEKIDYECDIKKVKILQKKFEKGMKLFAKYFNHLWD